MSRIECSECHDLIDTTARTVVLPFVCDECQKAPELLAAMAPAPLQIEESDNVPCGCTPTDEATSLLLEDLSNQLEMSKVEAETLRTLLNAAEVREAKLQNHVDDLLIRNFFKDEKIKLQAKKEEALGIRNFELSREIILKAFFEAFFLRAANSKLHANIENLRKEFAYAATRVFELAALLGQAEKRADVWEKRAGIAKRAYDRASADRRAYREELKALKAARG